jgi:hypothetical protein
MFPECRLLHKELNEFNRIAAKETYVIVIAKVVLIGEMIVTHFGRFPRVDARCVGHVVQSFE